MPKIGYKQTEEHKGKLSRIHRIIGSMPPSHLGKKRSDETKRKISIAKTGVKRGPLSNEQKKKIGDFFRGKKLSLELRRKMSEVKMGDKNPGWKGGMEPESKAIRKRIEYRLWRESVFKRDNWTCQKTGQRGGRLHPHHIKNFSQFPELRFAIDNGITLSEKAHKEFHKKYGIENNTREQIKNFLNS